MSCCAETSAERTSYRKAIENAATIIRRGRRIDNEGCICRDDRQRRGRAGIRISRIAMSRRRSPKRTPYIARSESPEGAMS